MEYNCEIIEYDVNLFKDTIMNLLNLQNSSDVNFIRKEGELLFLIKNEPYRPVKYYMNKSKMSSRWFNEILKQLINSNLVIQEVCKNDSRRRLLR